MRLGIFGGTFNPIHFGHLRPVEEARDLLGLDKVLFIPSGNPPLKSADVAEAGMRLHMTGLAVRDNPCFEVLDIECRRPLKSYSVDTLTALMDLYPEAELFFMLGIDAFLDIPNWWMPDRLVSLVDFVVFSRPGRSFRELMASPYLSADPDALERLDEAEVRTLDLRLHTGRRLIMLNVTPLGISSSSLRKQIASGESIKYLLPEQVESYIILNRLYSDENKK